ncbi:MAG: homoserine dehydrogenase [Candidatus Omnitrophota bacterium]
MQKRQTVNIGLFGLGTVGTGVVKILQSQAAALEKKTGVRVVLKKICVKNPGKKRLVKVNRRLIMKDAKAILKDPFIDIVVELIGGIHPAKELILEAFRSGKHVVTANKALLAEAGDSVFGAALKYSRELGIEASVCGGIPIIKSIREGLASNNITHFLGIVNGTCNYILSAMSKGSDFRSALKDAQAKGYAERNPRLDVEGVDSAHKLAILARLAFRAAVPFGSIAVEGIESLCVSDIEYARELGYTVKLLAVGKKLPRGLELRVHPTLLHKDHPLSSVNGVYNAVFVHGDQAGDLLFYGRGAGMFPTASAVMSDVLDIARKHSDHEACCPGAPQNAKAAAKVLSLGDIVSKYYLRFQAADKPGVLGRIAETLGANGISILSVHQKESHDSMSVPVVILTYEAREANLRRALKKIDAQKDIREKTVVLRVEK